MAQVLVVDDEQSLREVLGTLLERDGHNVVVAEDVRSAITCCEQHQLDLVYTDLKLPDGSGMEIVRYVRERQPDAQVIVMTAFATTETAVDAMRLGAYDYQLKPFKIEEVRAITHKALEKVALIRDNQQLSAVVKGRYGLSPIVGSSPEMTKLLSLVEKVAPTRATVLIEGESGTGKELVARAVHDSSSRGSGPFVAVNCGAIPETLIEAELFGHAAGAYTGANKARAGLFEAAQGGTLLLDEVGELPPNVQVKLLRVIQERRIRRVGDDKERPVDVRLVAATNRDLQAMVDAQEFREDLFYRLNVVRLRVPPLRERRGDVPLLARAFLDKYRRENGKALEGFSPDALQRMKAFDYPGNVRQLENIVERAVALAGGSVVEADDLPDELSSRSSEEPELDYTLSADFDLKARLHDIERGYIASALEASNGVKTHAASLLGLSFRSFRHRLKKLGIDDHEDERDPDGDDAELDFDR